MVTVKNPSGEVRRICDELKRYLVGNKLHAAVLGISGGIDSTLVAMLLNRVSEELKEEKYDFKFYGVSLPTRTTDQNEFWASQLVGNAFCDHFHVDKGMDNIAYAVSEWVSMDDDTKIEPLRAGNIKSRLRMIYLYDMAKKHNGLVVGTDNVSEYLLGFSTIGGDALFDYNPIKDLWKSDVFELSRYFLQTYAEKKEYSKASAAEVSLLLKPMDGLGISTDDMVQIGARNYYDVDDILQWYISAGRPNNEDKYPEFIESSLDGFKIKKATIKRVVDRHKGSEFKRREYKVNFNLG
jgi:NAD+ synthase